MQRYGPCQVLQWVPFHRQRCWKMQRWATGICDNDKSFHKSCTRTSVSDIHPFPSISIFGKTFHLDLDLFGHAKCWEIKRKNHSEARRFLMLSGTFLCCLAGDFMRFQRSDQELTSLYATLFVVHLIYTYYFPYQSALAAGTKCTKRHKLCLSLLLFRAGSPLFVDWNFPR